jgi:hypothetical protein
VEKDECHDAAKKVSVSNQNKIQNDELARASPHDIKLDVDDGLQQHASNT